MREYSSTPDYSIHYFEPQHLLIAHMRYIGSDYDKDMAVIAADPETHKWWEVSVGELLSIVQEIHRVQPDSQSE